MAMNKLHHENGGFEHIAKAFAPIFSELNDSLGQLDLLVDAFFTPITNDDELHHRTMLVDELYGFATDENHVAAKFAELIVDRIYEYEASIVEYPKTSQAEVLAFLMEANTTRQVDLKGIATQSVISEIVNGKRQMTVDQIKGFSDFFNVPVSLFYHF